MDKGNNMWHWDQGRLEYFQFDNLRKIASFICKYDIKNTDRSILVKETGLQFYPDSYSPWRNYSRIIKSMFLAYENDDIAYPTEVAKILSEPGLTSCDDYMHYIASVSTEPSPALKGWDSSKEYRYPLLFVLKYIYSCLYIMHRNSISIDEIIGAYNISCFSGCEKQADFACLLTKNSVDDFIAFAKNNKKDYLYRQSRESILVLAQISYLTVSNGFVNISLSEDDAINIFDDLECCVSDQNENKEIEIRNRANLFRGGSIYNDFEYENTMLNNVIESGFIEGGRVKRTHISIERNSAIRKQFFKYNTSAICDLCKNDTKSSYPWVDRVLDLHHLLPLSSGTRVEVTGTTLEHIIPLCPTCHRALHRYYDIWLKSHNKKDFVDKNEAVSVYEEVKRIFNGLKCVIDKG